MSRTDRILKALTTMVPPGFDSWAAVIEEVRARPEFWAQALRVDSLEDSSRRGMILGLRGEVVPLEPATLQKNIEIFQKWSESEFALLSQATRQDKLRDVIEQLTEAEQSEILTKIEWVRRLFRGARKIMRLKKSSGSLGGRKPVEAAKKEAVSQTVNVLVKDEHLTKTKAVQQAAKDHALSEREVWMILSAHTAQAMTGYVTTEPIAGDQKQQAFPSTHQPPADDSSASGEAQRNKGRRAPGSARTHRPDPRQSR
jgi:hypothetical protein